MPTIPSEYPLISVITVVKNNVRTIERAIGSLTEQTDARWEYIVIDGESTDGTVDIIRKYEKYIFYWVSEKDNGSAEALNKGFAQAHGDLVGFLMADDWFEPGALKAVSEEYVKIVSSNARTDRNKVENNVGIITGAMNIVYTDGTVKHWGAENVHLDDFPKYHPISSVATFYSPAVRQKIGEWNNFYKIANDYDFFLRCYYEKIPFHVIPQTIINFSFGEGASTKSPFDTNLEGYHVAISNAEKYCPEKVPGLKEYYLSLFKWRALETGFEKLNDEICNKNSRYIRNLNLFLAHEKPIVLFGWGKYGKMMAGMLAKTDIQIAGVADNHKTAGGIEGYQQIDVGSIKPGNCFVIVTPVICSGEIEQQLIGMGLRKTLDYISIFDIAVLGM